MHCEPVNDECGVPYKSPELSEQPGSLLVVSANENELTLNCKYKIMIETRNKAGKTNSSGDLILSKLLGGV